MSCGQDIMDAQEVGIPTDKSIEVDSYYSKFDTESMHQRGAVISLRPMIQKAVRFQSVHLKVQCKVRSWPIRIRVDPSESAGDKMNYKR